MKKLALTIAIFLGISLSTYAQGGLFQYGDVSDESGVPSWFSLDQSAKTDPALPMLPGHGQNNNQNAPLGSGIAMLLGLGGAYLVAKKRKE